MEVNKKKDYNLNSRRDNDLEAGMFSKTKCYFRPYHEKNICKHIYVYKFR